MKQAAENTSPDHEGYADLIGDGKPVLKVPYSIWLPRHAYERPFIRAAFDDKHNVSHLASNGPYDFEMHIEQGSNPSTKIRAADVLLEKNSIRYVTGGPTKHLFEICPLELSVEGEFAKPLKQTDN